MSTLPATRTADEDTLTIGRAAASELARLLPSTVPLQVVPFTPGDAPAAGAVAVRASFVGAASADLVVVADQAAAVALEGADASISLADALRPALEAAAATLGAGVLDAAVAGPVGSALVDDGIVSFGLVPADGGPAQAWFALRLRPRPGSVPSPRGGATHHERSSLRLLHDVEMTLTAEIGRTRLPVRQVLELVPGTVLELDRAAGSPADVMVNGRLVARGEVVVVDEDYGIRITEIVATEGI
ncbi:flagellar motor switch protein FliN [Actinotalea sp. K2]|uniref:flagellar motor switch protein FliN n=1 Tax=Actinotalea sp. K2 TaxID=2939438 RepID=UPI00201703A2|nr:flagellar motor switch protein FliN [Actinotalea sp. K2]MCL3860869.1 flagellar motor switch protein FliN [Actinotalea sp. K2]